MSWIRDGSKPSVSSADPVHADPAESNAQIVLGETITVTLVKKADEDLQVIHDRTQLSKTDIINRAVSLYEFVDTELNEGAVFIIRKDGHDFIVKLM